MLIQVCLLLLSAGAYASISEDATGKELFGELDFIFPENFLSMFPESEFFSTKILVYLFFNLFAKHFGENEPIKYWSKFNHHDFNRVAIDAAFYEYLTKFADRKTKPLIFNPLKSSITQEDIAIDRIGDYLDNLSDSESTAEQSETRMQYTKTKYHKRQETKCAEISVTTPTFGIPGEDYPNYCDIPTTSFTCADKLVPGIYADTETKCQVFHTCWPHRIDSFLCPIGTTFNQALFTCDLWHESDCLSSPTVFGFSPFTEGKTPGNADSSVSMDETQGTPESPILTPELDVPEFDGTCQSLIHEPLRLNMKFLPEKCKVADLCPRIPETTGGYDGERFDRPMIDIPKNFKEMIAFVIKAAERGSGKQGAAKRPVLKKNWSSPKFDSKIVKMDTESPSKADVTVEEQIYPSTTELPSDNQKEYPPRMDFIFEKSVFKESSQGKVKHWSTEKKSTPLKQSKHSESDIRQVFNTVARSLELGRQMIDDLLPLLEKIVLDSHRKKSNSESPVVDAE